MTIFEQNNRIPVYDTGFDGRVYIHSLLNYIQDISAVHAEILKFGRDDLLAEFYRLPSWGETITLKTWPRGTEGLFALRDIEITDGEGKIIAAASIEVNYLAEGVDGNHIAIRKEMTPEENNRQRYSVIRSSDGRELCRIMIAWEPAAN